jgi:hypothetical protein
LSLLVNLHAELPPEFINWTVIHTAVGSVIDDSTSCLVPILKCETHLDILCSRATTEHEIGSLSGAFNKYGLLDTLVDDELVPNEMVFDLFSCQSESLFDFQSGMHTLSAFIHVIRLGSGS